MKGGDLNHALRVATTGVMIGPGVFECLAILGKDETLRRIETALTTAENNMKPPSPRMSAAIPGALLTRMGKT